MGIKFLARFGPFTWSGEYIIAANRAAMTAAGLQTSDQIAHELRASLQKFSAEPVTVESDPTNEISKTYYYFTIIFSGENQQ